MKNKFPIGISVTATPKNGDFANEFVGTVIGHDKGFIQVKDQDDNVFDCEPEQLSFEIEDTRMHPNEPLEYMENMAFAARPVKLQKKHTTGLAKLAALLFPPPPKKGCCGKCKCGGH